MRRRLLCSSGELDVKSPLYLRVAKDSFMTSNPTRVKPDPQALEFDFNGNTNIYTLNDGTSTSGYYEFYVDVDDIKDFFESNNIKKGDSIKIRCMSNGTGVQGYDFFGNNYTNVLSQAMSGGIVNCDCAYLLDDGTLNKAVDKDGATVTKTIYWSYLYANVTAETTGLASNTATVTPTSVGNLLRNGSTVLSIVVPKNGQKVTTTHTITLTPTNTAYRALSLKYAQNAQSTDIPSLDNTIYIKLPKNYKTQVDNYIGIYENVTGVWEYNITPMVSNDKFVMGCNHGTDVFFSKGSITSGNMSHWSMTNRTPCNMVFTYSTTISGYQYNGTVLVQVTPGATGQQDKVVFNIQGYFKENLCYRWSNNDNSQRYEMMLDFDGTGSNSGELRPIE